MKNLFSIGVYVLMAVAFSACTKDDNNPRDDQNDINKIKLSQITQSGIKVILWSDTALYVGYNRLYFTIADAQSGKAIKNISASMQVTMDMGGTMMYAPAEAPVWDDNSGLYGGATVFTMEGNEGMGRWDIEISFENPNDNTNADFVFHQDVTTAAFTTIVTGQGNDNNEYMVTLVQPVQPKIGMNDLELLVDKVPDMDMDMDYTPVNDLNIQFTPQMPDMEGMTSSNNVNPGFTANGHYAGKVNLDMTGKWQLDIAIQKQGALLMDTLHFDFTF